MIDKDSLRQVSNAIGLENLGYVEKDYLQDIVLSFIYQNVGNEMIFKGGTALYKFYNLNRFSENLDFTINSGSDLDQKKVIKKVRKGLENYGASSELEEKQYNRGNKYILRIDGPLFTGKRISLCKLSLDLNSDSEVKEFERKMRFTNYQDITSFEVLVASQNEIAAEKIRAIMTRDKARDVYDLWFLLKKSIMPSRTLIQRKLDYYGVKWDFDEFKKSIEEKEQPWNKELSQFVLSESLPEFEQVKNKIFESLKSN